MPEDTRVEHDLLGEATLPAAALYGIHTARALENFPLAERPVPRELVHALGAVKLACAETNLELGAWSADAAKAEAITAACREMAAGALDEHVRVDLLQGGAGTSTNMNVNEVLANRALELLGLAHGRYDRVSPLDDLNLHQSTNDVYPTALRLAAIRLLHGLETSLVGLQEAFQAQEQRWAHVVRVGRTEMQDAVLTTMGRQMSAYAEALSRDRWRIYKCEERLRLVNLGGTAIGTAVCAPRPYVFRVAERLRELTGIGFARAENLVEATQNTDVFVEVSGLLKACATNLLKICGDLRLLSSGPHAGLGELMLPARQAGSSIMPGKVNPVIPEAVSQVAMWVIGHDAALTLACASGSLELNPFLPVVAAALLESLELLARGADILRRHCVEGIVVDETRCRVLSHNSTAVATALVPALGYEQVSTLASRAAKSGKSLRALVLEEGVLSEQAFDELTSAEAVCRLGSPTKRGGAVE